jgi:hypothetical protein
MTIKYGEIYVKHNTENLWTNMVFWVSHREQTVSEDSTIVVKFDDGDVQEISNELFGTNDKIEIGKNFIIKHDNAEHTYFKQNPEKESDGTRTLCFRGIFKNYKIYDSNNNIASYYNSIYYKHKLVDTTVKKMDVFAILRVKSSVSSPIYKIAYDSDDLSKEEILYIINCIFRDKTTQPSSS